MKTLLERIEKVEKKVQKKKDNLPDLLIGTTKSTVLYEDDQEQITYNPGDAPLSATEIKDLTDKIDKQGTELIKYHVADYGKNNKLLQETLRGGRSIEEQTLVAMAKSDRTKITTQQYTSQYKPGLKTLVGYVPRYTFADHITGKGISAGVTAIVLNFMHAFLGSLAYDYDVFETYEKGHEYIANGEPLGLLYGALVIGTPLLGVWFGSALMNSSKTNAIENSQKLDEKLNTYIK